MSPSFADLGVPAPLRATLARRGIDEPFPIQAATLPDALAGRDVAGKAPTGSGKTLAFALAIAARAGTAGPVRPRRPRALVLVPTRELAAQVQRELAAFLDEPVAAVYGGVGYGPQRRLLARGVSAVVACPGRLEDLVATGHIHLDGADVVVLDEADRMADMGFLPAVRRLVDRTPRDRQTLLFSATLDGDVDTLVRCYQRDPAHHEVAGADGTDVEVDHLFWRTARDARIAVTADIVQRVGPTIVFSRTRHGADRITRQLGRAGVGAVAIHGRLSQAQRDRALAQFRDGRAPALVATDVAARGIHVDGVACVVHFDVPDDPKDYVHRSGRTGRAGAPGVVVSLVPEDGQRSVRALQRHLGRTEPLEEPAPERLARTATAAPAPRERLGDPDRAATAVAGAAAERAAAPASHAAAPPAGGRRERARRPARNDRTSRSSRPHRSDRRARPDAAAGARGVAGTVSSYNPARGYGFISRRGGADVFVHVSALSGPDQTLSPGQRVRFELAPGRRGHQATNVRPVR
jgi:superfamily II DNA/RNA helicase